MNGEPALSCKQEENQLMPNSKKPELLDLVAVLRGADNPEGHLADTHILRRDASGLIR